MKRPIIYSIFLLLIGALPAAAQGYDDIYYTPADAQQEAQQQAREDARDSARYVQRRSQSFSEEQQEGSGGYYRGDDYVDYENDYYYATNINRFYRPFHNMGFYSAFYNPYWYDPFWVDPYWGWSPWIRPGITISFGSPYWTSYGGWYSWYGYPGFYSAWTYPYYAGGWYGYNAGYYSGYWNGYYAGLYNNYGGGYRAATYGPRYSLNAAHNSNIRTVANNVHGSRSNAIRVAENPRRIIAQPRSNSNTVRPGIRSNDIRNNDVRQAPDRSIRGNDIRNNEIRQAAPIERAQPGRFQSQPNSIRNEAPQMTPRSNDRNFETPRQQMPVRQQAPVRQVPQIRQQPARVQPQAPTRTYDAPTRSYQAPTRSYEAPSRNYSAPSRSVSPGSGGGGSRSNGGFRR